MNTENSQIVDLLKEAKALGRQLCRLSSQLGCGADVIAERGPELIDHTTDLTVGRVWLENLLPELESEAQKLSHLAAQIRGH